jgi:MFS family permease
MAVAPGFAQLLAQRAFMRLWWGRLAGTIANQMLVVAIGWHMYELTGSAWDLGLVGLYQFVPGLLLAVPAGHAVDRWHRGRIAAACLAVQAMVSLVLLEGSLSGRTSRELLLLVSVVIGSVRAFQMASQQALTPMLVPPALLQRATAFAAAGLQASVIGGPALAGLIFMAGTGAVYATSTVLSLAGCVLLLMLRYVAAPPPHEPVTLRSLLAGVSFTWQRKVVLGALSLDLFAVLLGGATALLPIFARDILQVGPTGLGLLRAAPAVGALVVSLVLARRSLDGRVGRTLLSAVALFGLSIVVFGLSTNFYLSLFALAISGAADMVSVVIRQTLVQLETPDHMRGRVSAVNAVFIGASNQLGEFESGALAAGIGAVGSAVVGGVGTIVVAVLWARLFPALLARDRMDGHRTAPEAATTGRSGLPGR